MILMHRNNKVASLFHVNDYVTGVDKIINKELLPVGMFTEPLLINNSFFNWFNNRAIPHVRMDLDRLMAVTGKKITDMQANSLNVSLNDCYWINNDLNLKWEDVDFHRNGFKNDFFDTVYFNGNINDFNCPDVTTNGVLKKAWINKDGIPYLIKDSLNKTPLQSANEVIACKIASKMGINSVSYKLIRLNNRTLCMSRCMFLDDTKELVYAQDLAKANMLKELIDIFTDLGFKEHIDKMLIFDYLIKNTNRHEYNFGVLRDSITLKTTDFAPLFDSGSCLNFNYDPNIRDMGECKPFRRTWDKQLKLVDNVVNIPNEKWITDVIDDVYDKAGIPDYYAKIAKIGLSDRITQINLINEKNKTKDKDIDNGYDRT